MKRLWLEGGNFDISPKAMGLVLYNLTLQVVRIQYTFAYSADKRSYLEVMGVCFGKCQSQVII